MNEHIQLHTIAPRVYDAFLDLREEVADFSEVAGLSPSVVELVNVRASQLNGCSYCLRLHSRLAREQGETADRLAVLSSWRDTDYFTPEERAALSLTEKTTLSAHVPSTPYDDSEERRVLTDEQAAAVQWIAMAINVYNRVSLISRYEVKP